MLLNKQVQDTGMPNIPTPQPKHDSPRLLIPHDMFEALPPNCRVLHGVLLVMSESSVLTVTIPSSVLATSEPVEIHVTRDDCLDLFRCDWLNTSVLELWLL